MVDYFRLGKGKEEKIFDITKLRSGLSKQDLGIEGEELLESIFEKFNTNKEGDSADKLDKDELKAFFNEILELCGKDDHLSEKEARNFTLDDGTKLGKESGKELINFINKLYELTTDIIEPIDRKGEENSEIIHYNNGDSEQRYANGRIIKVTKDYNDPENRITKIITTEANGDEKIEEIVKTSAGSTITTITINGVIVSKETITPEKTEKISYNNEKPEKKTIKYANPEIFEEYSYDTSGNPVLSKRIDKSKRETVLYDGDTKTTIVEQDGKTHTSVETNGQIVKDNTVEIIDNKKKETDRVYDNDNYTETVTVDDKPVSQTKLIDGQEYDVNYDTGGNTLGIIVQNRESIEDIVKKFGVDRDALIAANPDVKIYGKNKKAHFEYGAEIRIPRKMDADETVLQNRKSAEDVRAEHQNDVRIENQRREAARLAAEKTIVTCGNGYYITQDGYGNYHYYDSNKKPIDENTFKNKCPDTYHSTIKGQKKRTAKKYDTRKITEEARPLAQKIRAKICGATSNSNTINLLRGLTTENIAFVISEYQRLYNVSLVKDIDDEWGLNYKTIQEYICPKLVQQANSLGLKVVRDYTKITDIKDMETWVNGVSKAIREKMEKDVVTYYANDNEESVRQTQRRNEKNSENYAKTCASQIVDDLIKNASGYNDVTKIKAAIARIDSPETLKEVNRLLTYKNYPPTDKYSPIEHFIYEEANHSLVHTYNSSDYLEQTVQKWLKDGILKGQDANEAQARMAARVLYDGGDGFGTDCNKMKKAVRMIKCPTPTGNKEKDNAQAREVYRLVNEMIKKHNTFYGLGKPSENLLDYCRGEMWESEVKYLNGILAETNAIEGQEKAQAIVDLTQEAVEYAGTNIEYLEQAIRAIDSPKDRKNVEAKFEEYCKKKGIKPKIEGQSYIQAILYDECDTFMGISTDHKEIRKFNEMLIKQGAYTEEEVVNLRAEQATLQMLEGDFDNIKDAVEQIKDPKVLAKIETLLKSKKYNSLEDFLNRKLNQTKRDVILAKLASNNVLLEAQINFDVEKIADIAFRLMQNSDFNTRAAGLNAIRNNEVADAVDKKLKQNGSSLSKFMEQFNKDKAECKSNAAFWNGLGKFIPSMAFFAEEISDAYKENTDISDNLYVEIKGNANSSALTQEQKEAYQMTVQIMEQRLNQMKKDYQAALDSQGAVSWAVNRFCEQWWIGTTREEIEARIEHDTETLRLLKLAAEGKLGKIENGKTVAVSFEAIFKERNIGTKFDTQKMQKVQNQAGLLVAMDYAKDKIAVCWEELENGLSSSDRERLIVAIIDSLEKISVLSQQPLTLESFGYFINNNTIIDKDGKPAKAEDLKVIAEKLKEGLSEISKELYGESIPLNTSASKINDVLEDYYNNRKDKFKTEFKDAFGQNCPDEMVENYISTIETGMTVATIGGIIVAAIAAPLTGGGSLSAFLGVSTTTGGAIASGIGVAGVSLGISGLEHSTDSDGWTYDEWTADLTQALWDGALTAAGYKVGSIVESSITSRFRGPANTLINKAINRNLASSLKNQAINLNLKIANISTNAYDLISVLVARTMAAGIEITSDALQTCIYMACQHGEFDWEIFKEFFIISFIGNTAGHTVGIVSNLKGANNAKASGVNAGKNTNANSSVSPRKYPANIDKEKYPHTLEDVTKNPARPDEIADSRCVGKLNNTKFNSVREHLKAQLEDFENLTAKELESIQKRIDALQNREQRRELQHIFDNKKAEFEASKATPKTEAKAEPQTEPKAEPKAEKASSEEAPKVDGKEKADRVAKMGKRLAKYYDKVISAIGKMKNYADFNKILNKITTKFKDFKDDMKVLLDELFTKAKNLKIEIPVKTYNKYGFSKYYSKSEIKAFAKDTSIPNDDVMKAKGFTDIRKIDNGDIYYWNPQDGVAIRYSFTPEGNVKSKSIIRAELFTNSGKFMYIKETIYIDYSSVPGKSKVMFGSCPDRAKFYDNDLSVGKSRKKSNVRGTNSSKTETIKLNKEQPVEIQGTEKLKLADDVEIDLNAPDIKSEIDNLTEGGFFTIGRKGKVSIDSSHRTVSRTHVIITKRNGKIYIIDKSQCGTTVTGNAGINRNGHNAKLDPIILSRGQMASSRYAFSNLADLPQILKEKLNIFSKNTQNNIIECLNRNSTIRLQKNGKEYNFKIENGHVIVDEFNINEKYNIAHRKIDKYHSEVTFEITNINDFFWALPDKNIFSAEHLNKIKQHLYNGQSYTCELSGIEYTFTMDRTGKVTVKKFEKNRYQTDNPSASSGAKKGDASNPKSYPPEVEQQIRNIDVDINTKKNVIQNAKNQINGLRTYGNHLPVDKIKTYRESIGLDNNMPLTEENVNAAYKKRMLKLHPDRHPGEEAVYEELTREASNARDKLIDEINHDAIVQKKIGEHEANIYALEQAIAELEQQKQALLNGNY